MVIVLLRVVYSFICESLLCLIDIPEFRSQEYLYCPRETFSPMLHLNDHLLDGLHGQEHSSQFCPCDCASLDGNSSIMFVFRAQKRIAL